LTISRRELVIAEVTIAVALFGATALLARPRIDEWQALRREQKQVRSDIDADREMLASHDRWDAKYNEMKSQLTQHTADERVTVHWLSLMDTLASKHGVKISRRQAGKEERSGDIYELPIECRAWEGSLDSVVAFLYELQSQGGTLNIRHLLMKPDEKKMLKGRFTLYCAYTREKVASSKAASPPGL
jgi:Tfp pilus assembly protein PilO